MQRCSPAPPGSPLPGMAKLRPGAGPAPPARPRLSPAAGERPDLHRGWSWTCAEAEPGEAKAQGWGASLQQDLFTPTLNSCKTALHQT